jgi:hypothetical protein
MLWYKITLTDEQMKRGVYSYIQDQFFQAFRESGGPDDAAMFQDTKEKKIFYFTPGTTKFFMDGINQYMGEETEKPTRTEVALLVGHDKIWNIFFSERNKDDNSN